MPGLLALSMNKEESALDLLVTLMYDVPKRSPTGYRC